MTYEHRLIVDLREIKSIVFECSKCKTRVAITPDDLRRPPDACPSGHAWLWNVPMEYRGADSPFIGFLSGLNALRNPLVEQVGFKIYLEFEEPKSAE